MAERAIRKLLLFRAFVCTRVGVVSRKPTNCLKYGPVLFVLRLVKALHQGYPLPPKLAHAKI